MAFSGAGMEPCVFRAADFNALPQEEGNAVDKDIILKVLK